MKGDGYQNGGLLVVEKGGKLLYSYMQENPADHANNDDILKVNFRHSVVLISSYELSQLDKSDKPSRILSKSHSSSVFT